ncbi:heterotrimeric G-protein alpha subunit, GPA2-like protein [Mycena galericulata]|nr:heterotrimeric G-protein alpha subunit, GPA2-like protein [Mycena galericulata]
MNPEDLLPKSAAIATAPKFRELVATVAESQIVKTLSDVPLHAHKSSFKKSKQPQGKAFSDSPARKTAKILLLGSADSGKSTLLKQMRIIYSVPFSSHEIESYRQLVFDNLGLGIQPLLESLSDFGLSLPHALLPAAKIVQSERDLRFGEPFPRQWLGAITRLWNDSIVQEAFRRGGEHALLENMSYLCADLPRLFSPSFVPTNRDILHLRARTIGITETDIPYGIGAPVIDVGGARSERRKWIHVFEDLIKVIIFTVSLSGYDRVLIEDSLRNQMQDAMQLWDSICHSRYFERTPIILCFTKNDLFEQEVLRSDIVDFFPDFQGARGDAVAGCDYFIKRFRSLAKPKDDVFIHVVTATDTETMRGLLESVGAFLPSS